MAVMGMRGGPRTSFFTKSGEYLGAWDPTNPAGERVSLLGGGEGAWVGNVRRGGFRPESEWVMVQDTARIHRLAPADGSRAGPIATLPMARRLHPSVAGALFDARPWLGVDGAGRLYHSHGDPYRIDVYEPDGRLIRSVRRDIDERDMDPDWIQAYLDRVDSVDAATPPGMVSNSRQTGQGRVDAMVMDHLPPLERLLVDPEGAIWVERRDRDPAPDVTEFERVYGRPSAVRQATWDVFDADGEYTGTVELPPTFTPYDVDGATVTGVELDELEVELVVTYRAEPEAPPSDAPAPKK